MTDADLKENIEAQKTLMVAVATGGPRIQEVSESYSERRAAIQTGLHERGIVDPNPFDTLWEWYGRWSDGTMPHYRDRRIFVEALYRPLLQQLTLGQRAQAAERVVEPTGWQRVDRALNAAIKHFEIAQNEEDFQAVGLLCREVIISIAQAVHDPLVHPSLDGVRPSDTDAKRMLEAFIAHELKGRSNETIRKYARSSVDMAIELQHRRTAQQQHAALCMEATASLVNVVAVIARRREVKIVARKAPVLPADGTGFDKALARLRRDSLYTRMSRLLKLYKAGSEFGSFTLLSPEGRKIRYDLPSMQGRFHLHSLTSPAGVTQLWYVAQVGDGRQAKAAMADLRVLLDTCKPAQETTCRFIIATDDALGEEKAALYRIFAKMLEQIPEPARGFFSLEIWDEPVLQSKETEVGLRVEDTQ